MIDLLAREAGGIERWRKVGATTLDGGPPLLSCTPLGRGQWSTGPRGLVTGEGESAEHVCLTSGVLSTNERQPVPRSRLDRGL